MLSRSRQATGFTLIETMVAIVFGLLLLIGVYKVYSAFIGSGFENLAKSKLHQEVNDSLKQMTQNLRRATGEISKDNSFAWDTNMLLKLTDDEGNVMVITPGNPFNFPVVEQNDIGPILGAGPAFGNGRVQLTRYNGSGASAEGIVLVPFLNLPSNGKLKPGEWFVAESGIYKIGDPLRLFNPGVSNSGSCILFVYDKDKDNTIDTAAAGDERYGYRLKTVSGVGTVEQRTGGDFDDCDSGNWTAMTNSNTVNVTNLNYTLSSVDISGNNGGTIKRIKITSSISANLVANASTSTTMTRTIHLRNEQYVP